MPMLPRVKDYDSLRRQFQWRVPSRYNIGVDVCDRWAEKEPDRLAILYARPDGRDVPITYGWLRDTSNRLANALRAHARASSRSFASRFDSGSSSKITGGS